MDDCVIEFREDTGQLVFCEGADRLDSIWDTNEQLQARDRNSGARYMISIQGDAVATQKVTLH